MRDVYIPALGYLALKTHRVFWGFVLTGLPTHWLLCLFIPSIKDKAFEMQLLDHAKRLRDEQKSHADYLLCYPS